MIMGADSCVTRKERVGNSAMLAIGAHVSVVRISGFQAENRLLYCIYPVRIDSFHK